jgi:hypothetical protein
MKPLLAATAAIALFATAPAFAADVDANSTGGKPSTGTETGNTPAAKNEKSYDSTGTSTGTSGTATERQMPGASDSTKPDSSLSTNGNKMKQ